MGGGGGAQAPSRGLEVARLDSPSLSSAAVLRFPWFGALGVGGTSQISPSFARLGLFCIGIRKQLAFGERALLPLSALCDISHCGRQEWSGWYRDAFPTCAGAAPTSA